MQQDPPAPAQEDAQQQLAERTHEVHKRPGGLWDVLRRPAKSLALTEIGPHHRELNRWMRRGCSEDLKDSVTIRAKKPPMVSDGVKDQGIRLHLGQLTTMDPKVDIMVICAGA